jgi:hypothetical protein
MPAERVTWIFEICEHSPPCPDSPDLTVHSSPFNVALAMAANAGARARARLPIRFAIQTRLTDETHSRIGVIE